MRRRTRIPMGMVMVLVIMMMMMMTTRRRTTIMMTAYEPRFIRITRTTCIHRRGGLTIPWSSPRTVRTLWTTTMTWWWRWWPTGSHHRPTTTTTMSWSTTWSWWWMPDPTPTRIRTSTPTTATAIRAPRRDLDHRVRHPRFPAHLSMRLAQVAKVLYPPSVLT